MTKEKAMKKLRKHINHPDGHTALFKDKHGEYSVELHRGPAILCNCLRHKNLVWRERPGLTKDTFEKEVKW